MTRKDKILAAIEYFIAGMFIYGGINSFFAHPIDTPSVFYDMLAGQTAIYIYAAIFFSIGVLLLLAKLRKWKRIHGYALMGMYLICMYVFILSWLVMGPTYGLIQTVIIGILCAVCWLRWRIKTSYINPKDFEDARHLTS